MSLVSFSEEFGQNSSNQNYQLGWNFINAMQTIQHAVKKKTEKISVGLFFGVEGSAAETFKCTVFINSVC